MFLKISYRPHDCVRVVSEKSKHTVAGLTQETPVLSGGMGMVNMEASHIPLSGRFLVAYRAAAILFIKQALVLLYGYAKLGLEVVPLSPPFSLLGIPKLPCPSVGAFRAGGKQAIFVIYVSMKRRFRKLAKAFVAFLHPSPPFAKVFQSGSEDSSALSCFGYSKVAISAEKPTHFFGRVIMVNHKFPPVVTAYLASAPARQPHFVEFVQRNPVVMFKRLPLPVLGVMRLLGQLLMVFGVAIFAGTRPAIREVFASMKISKWTDGSTFGTKFLFFRVLLKFLPGVFLVDLPVGISALLTAGAKSIRCVTVLAEFSSAEGTLASWAGFGFWKREFRLILSALYRCTIFAVFAVFPKGAPSYRVKLRFRETGFAGMASPHFFSPTFSHASRINWQTVPARDRFMRWLRPSSMWRSSWEILMANGRSFFSFIQTIIQRSTFAVNTHHGAVPNQWGSVWGY